MTSVEIDLGYLVHVAGAGGAAQVYRETIELAVAAEELGFASFWVAQHHGSAAAGFLPSPLVMLAAIAERTSTIRLGTAVIAAALEQPRRLAEDAAVVDVLSGGRLQLGFGGGNDPVASAVFRRDHERRHADCTDVIDEVVDALEGASLVPSAPGLRQRMWWATGSPTGLDAAAARGIGILSGRPDAQAAAGLARHRAASLGVPRAIACRLIAAGEPMTEVLDRWQRDPFRDVVGELVVQTQPPDAPFGAHLATLRTLGTSVIADTAGTGPVRRTTNRANWVG